MGSTPIRDLKFFVFPSTKADGHKRFLLMQWVLLPWPVGTKIFCI